MTKTKTRTKTKVVVAVAGAAVVAAAGFAALSLAGKGPFGGTAGPGPGGTSAGPGGATQTADCLETDGGFKPHKFGVVQTSAKIKRDVCISLSSGGNLQKVQACDPDIDPGCLLDEYVCSADSGIDHGFYQCEDYCYEGECRQKPDSGGADEPDPVTDPPDVSPPDLTGADSPLMPGTSSLETGFGTF